MKNTVSIMPCLDIRRGRVVKGIHFSDIIDVGDPVERAVNYEADGADELGFLDIAAAMEQSRPDFDLVRQVTDAVKIPLTLGGGIQSLADVEAARTAGAVKVSLSTWAFRNPALVKEAVARFGREAIVVAIDANRNAKLPSRREVFVDGGQTPTGVDAVEFARKMADLGAGTLLLTSIVADGAKRGYDLDLIRSVTLTTKVPVVASGGAGKLVHFLEAVKEGHASTLLAASVFHFGIFTVRQIKTYLMGQHVAVRQPPVPRM